MVQKEVGDRFNAKVGTKDYNSLTVFLNYYFDIKKLMNVSRNSFVPAPNVDSVIIEMDKKKNNYAVENEKLFFNIIRDSFKFKRKNLRNNLKCYNLDKILEVLKEYDLDLTVRAENLTIEQFIEISNKLNEIGVPARLKGYRYMITAVKEVISNEDALEGVTKVLYPDVAKKHNSTPQRVEKAIRHAIEVAWSVEDAYNNGSKDKYSVRYKKGRPTNSEFIAQISREIRQSA